MGRRSKGAERMMLTITLVMTTFSCVVRGANPDVAQSEATSSTSTREARQSAQGVPLVRRDTAFSIDTDDEQNEWMGVRGSVIPGSPIRTSSNVRRATISSFQTPFVVSSPSSSFSSSSFPASSSSFSSSSFPSSSSSNSFIIREASAQTQTPWWSRQVPDRPSQPDWAAQSDDPRLTVVTSSPILPSSASISSSADITSRLQQLLRQDGQPHKVVLDPRAEFSQLSATPDPLRAIYAKVKPERTYDYAELFDQQARRMAYRQRYYDKMARNRLLDQQAREFLTSTPRSAFIDARESLLSRAAESVYSPRSRIVDPYYSRTPAYYSRTASADPSFFDQRSFTTSRGDPYYPATSSASRYTELLRSADPTYYSSRGGQSGFRLSSEQFIRASSSSVDPFSAQSDDRAVAITPRSVDPYTARRGLSSGTATFSARDAQEAFDTNGEQIAHGFSYKIGGGASSAAIRYPASSRSYPYEYTSRQSANPAQYFPDQQQERAVVYPENYQRQTASSWTSPSSASWPSSAADSSSQDWRDAIIEGGRSSGVSLARFQDDFDIVAGRQKASGVKTEELTPSASGEKLKDAKKDQNRQLQQVPQREGHYKYTDGEAWTERDYEDDEKAEPTTAPPTSTTRDLRAARRAVIRSP